MAKWNPKIKTEISEIASGLHLITNTSSKTRVRIAYLLERKGGNVLFHGPDHKKIYEEILPTLEKLGGVVHHLMTHAPEVSKSMAELEKTFGTTLHIQKHDAPFAQKDLSGLSYETFEENASPLRGIESTWLPGHTLGFSTFGFSCDGKRYLIMGDIISEVTSGWKPRINGHLIKEGLASLEKLKKLRSDFYLPNQAVVGRPLPPLPTKDVLDRL